MFVDLSKYSATQLAVFEAAGFTPGGDNTSVSPRPVTIKIIATGKVISVDWQVAMDRIEKGVATLVQ